MSPVLSCLKHPLLSFIERASDILPNLEKLCIVFFNPHTQNIESALLFPENNKNDYEIEYLNTADTLQELQAKREKRQSDGWFSEDALGLKFEQISQKQLNIYSENNNRILQLSFRSDYDNHFDYLIIYFKDAKNKVVFGNKNIQLSSAEKNLIETIVKNTLHALYEMERSNKEAFELIQEAFKQVVNENDQNKKQLENMRIKLGQTYIELALTYLKKLSYKNNMGFDFNFDDEAMEKLSAFRGAPDLLEKVLERTFNVMCQIYAHSSEKVVGIPASLLNFDIAETLRKPETIGAGIKENDISVYNKTFMLLDKYEAAAMKLMKEGEKINITNIGKACAESITAAAVSDSIKKHIKKMNTLFIKYPERWHLIKEKLGPIKNKIVTNTAYNSNKFKTA